MALLSALLSCAAAPTFAVDLSASGFGTLGYARSNRDYGYQRFIDDGGTLQRDSVAGVQVDARFEHGFGATMQVKAAARAGRDTGYEPSIAWAFVSYRPSNDWLFRVGKQRIPLYLNSQNYDIGATFDFARLPTEMYSITPSNDAVGISLARTWRYNESEISFDGYWGESINDFRVWLRDPIPGVQASGPLFTDLKLRGGGLILAYKAPKIALRFGLHQALAWRRDRKPLVIHYPFVSLGPGVGYFQVDPSLPGPGVPMADRVTNTTITLGAELSLPGDFRLVTEFASSKVPVSDIAPQGKRGYVALLKPIDKWTPYVTYAYLRSPSSQRVLYDAVNTNTVPAAVPGAATINAAQRAGADQIQASDQHSWALGSSYSFSATSKLKAEYLRTRIGQGSKLIDAPPSSDIRQTSIGVWTLSYSVVF
ncbi:MAG: hypothetical protein ABIX46_00020 [Burkholderiaceae bacterium]